MGCPCALQLGGPDLRAAADAGIAEALRIERAFSRYRRDSRVAAINAAAGIGGAVDVDDETATLLDHAFDCYRLSEGLFDITSGALRRVWNDDAIAPPTQDQLAALLERIGMDKLAWARPRLSFALSGMEIDLGGLAKEYAADSIAAICRAQGATRGIVDLGGDLALFGANPDASLWRIGVADPLDETRVAATLFVGEGGVATSGDYRRYWSLGGRRYGHILNPRTGWPAEGLLSVTVAAETCLAAGARATIAVLKGDAGADWLAHHAADHIYIDRDGRSGGAALEPRRD